MPTPTATDIRALTLVIANQRTGSTLLGQDIASLGGMGVPKEHFLEILRASKTGEAEAHTEADVLEMIAKGAQEDAPHVGAVKLMVSYAPTIDAFIRGAPPVGQGKAVQNIIDWARARFETVNLIVLIRENVLDQTISQTMARETQIWHRKETAVEGGNPYADVDIKKKRLNLAILRALPAVMTRHEVLKRIAASNAEHCLTIDYDEMAASVEETSRKLVAHARANGLEPVNEVAKRKLRKLIDEDRSKEIKQGFRRFLENRLGLW